MEDWPLLPAPQWGTEVAALRMSLFQQVPDKQGVSCLQGHQVMLRAEAGLGGSSTVGVGGKKAGA